ncbi:MAG: MG2 domain-containing protein [Prolixibacteraceae bacterium]
MKTLTLLLIGIFAVLVLSAQETSPIPKISRQLTEYFSYYPHEKVFITTDKSAYKPGETIWFRAFVTDGNNQLSGDDNRELFVKLYNEKGEAVIQDIFRINKGAAPGDLLIPDDLPKDQYFLVAFTSAQISPEEITYTALKIDPDYSNQWVAKIIRKDSISIAGKQNELQIILRDETGDIQKNTKIQYEIRNGDEIISRDKLKTDASGEVKILYTLPEKTNGNPFTCNLSDLRDEWLQEVFLPSNIDPLIIHFYPEGGNLICGTPAKIGFTAFNKWGLPVDLEGSLTDQEGKPITLVKTFTRGLGLFSLNHDGKQKYKLIISGKTGQNQSFEIPDPQANGLALSVIKTDPEFISANLIFADKQKHPVGLTISRNGNLYWAGDMEIDGIGRIKIPAGNVPQGINLLSVFSADGSLLAERIIYMDKNRQLKIEVLPENTVMNPNQDMKVKIRLTDENNQPVSGNLTLTVKDKICCSGAKTRIDQYLEAASELETPFSIISEAFSGHIANSALLDVFLISNRLKSFDWGEINRFQSTNAPAVNMLNNGISGVVTDKNGEKVNKAKVSLVNNRNMQLFTTSTNAQGEFSIPNLNTVNSDDFSIKATDPDGKRELNAVFSKNFEGRISEYVKQMAQKYHLADQDQNSEETYLKNNPFLFQKAVKVVKPNTNSLDNQRRMLATSTSLLDVIKTIKPYRIMNNQIVFVGSENSLNHQGGALLVLDGQQLGTDISSIANISPMEVDHINVSTNPMDIQRYTGLNSVGVIEIFQKKAKPLEAKTKAEIQNKYDGEYRIPNVFPLEDSNRKGNTSTTLLWIPDQKVDENGLFEFTVNSGKVISDFVIEVQGITQDGRMGSGSAGFKVMK